MTDETEVLRIKREALEDVAQWMRDHKFSQWERDAFASYRQKHCPPPAPRKVRGYVEFGGFWARTQDEGWLEIGSESSPCPDVSLRRSDIATLAALDARADAEGMVEEDSLSSGACIKKETAPEKDSPAPALAPADARVWWLNTLSWGTYATEALTWRMMP